MEPRRRSDPGQGSGPPKYPGTFLLALREACAGLNWQVRHWKGDSVECVDAAGKDHVIGLDNLFRRARQIERADWPQLITEFLNTVGSIDPDENLPDSLDQAADQVLVRLGPPMNKLVEEARVWSQPLDDTGLWVNLVIDYPNRMCYVTEQLIRDSGRPGSRWLETALLNLATRTPANAFHVVDEETGLWMCSTGDAYDSSRALLLDRLLPEFIADGYFVALPGRDALFVLPVNSQGLGEVHILRLLAQKNYQSAPYPISEEVYWVQGGVWRRFPIHVKGEQITIEPPEEFNEVLDRLMPGEEEPDGDGCAEM
jgi:hypothetical protein